MFKIIFTGHLGRNPEKRISKEGKPLVTFSVASNKSKDNTVWVDCIVTDRLAEIAEKWLQKGSKVLIEGSPSVNAYISKDGKASASMQCFVNNLEMLGGGDNQPQHIAPTQANQASNSSNVTNPTPDDIPF